MTCSRLHNFTTSSQLHNFFTTSRLLHNFTTSSQLHDFTSPHYLISQLLNTTCSKYSFSQNLLIFLLLEAESPPVALTPDYGGPVVAYVDGVFDKRLNRYIIVRKDQILRGKGWHGLNGATLTCHRIDPNFGGYISDSGDIYKRVCVAGDDPSIVESPTEPKWSSEELRENTNSLHNDIKTHWLLRELALLKHRMDQANEKGDFLVVKGHHRFFYDNVPKDRDNMAMEVAKGCDAFLLLSSSAMTMSAI
ncbi:hypothetical protein Tco_0129147 [Tanacetum coccineum]